MAGFVFKFQNILNIKEQLEEKEKIILGQKMQALEKEKQMLASIEMMEQEAIQKFYDQKGVTLRAKELLDLNRSIAYFDERKKEQIVEVKKADDALEAQREVLRQAMIERKSMEKLKENAKEAYREVELDAESKLIDEIVSFKYHDS